MSISTPITILSLNFPKCRHDLNGGIKIQLHMKIKELTAHHFNNSQNWKYYYQYQGNFLQPLLFISLSDNFFFYQASNSELLSN